MRKTCTVYCSYFHIRNETSTHRDRIAWLDPLRHFLHMVDCRHHTSLLKSQRACPAVEVGFQQQNQLYSLVNCSPVACYLGLFLEPKTHHPNFSLGLHLTLLLYFIPILAHRQTILQQQRKSETNPTEYLTQSKH